MCPNGEGGANRDAVYAQDPAAQRHAGGLRRLPGRAAGDLTSQDVDARHSRLSVTLLALN